MFVDMYSLSGARVLISWLLYEGSLMAKWWRLGIEALFFCFSVCIAPFAMCSP